MACPPAMRYARARASWTSRSRKLRAVFLVELHYAQPVHILAMIHRIDSRLRKGKLQEGADAWVACPGSKSSLQGEIDSSDCVNAHLRRTISRATLQSCIHFNDHGDSKLLTSRSRIMQKMEKLMKTSAEISPLEAVEIYTWKYDQR